MARQYICDLCGKRAKADTYTVPFFIKNKIYDDWETCVGEREFLGKRDVNLCDGHKEKLANLLAKWSELQTKDTFDKE